MASIKVKYNESTGYSGGLMGFVFDKFGNLIEQRNVSDGVLSLKTTDETLLKSTLIISPAVQETERATPSLNKLRRLNAFEPNLVRNGQFVPEIFIPDSLVLIWPWAFCWVRGQVIKADSNLPICKARVHICEVDYEPFVLRLPDDLLVDLWEDIIPHIIPELNLPRPIPGPDPVPLRALAAQPISNSSTGCSECTSKAVTAFSANTRINPALIRQQLLDNKQLIQPYLCFVPLHRYLGYYQCDEVCVVDTDANGRFSCSVLYNVNGDHPDLYFWVEYFIDGIWQTVFRPTLPCGVYWNYACNSEVTIKVSDARVPACDPEGAPGSAIQFLSIGRGISLEELDGNGLLTDGAPLGEILEPRVHFGVDLIDQGVRWYRWSYRKLLNANGTPVMPAPTDADWVVINREVVRHYLNAAGDAFDAFSLGPASVGAEANLFQIKPVSPPNGGQEWVVTNERQDLATARWYTGEKLDNDPVDYAAGQYQLKLELFRDNGGAAELITDWAALGLSLQYATGIAPFGTGSIPLAPVPLANQLLVSGNLAGFITTVWVDNSDCVAEVLDVQTTGGAVVEPCGFIEFTDANVASIRLRFQAQHPHYAPGREFATFRSNLGRGLSASQVSNASTGYELVGTSPVSVLNAASTRAFTASGSLSDFYEEDFTPAELLGDCLRASFATYVEVRALANNGYTRLLGLDASDQGSFALTQPCP